MLGYLCEKLSDVCLVCICSQTIPSSFSQMILGGLDRRLPERERLNVTTWSDVRGQPQKPSFQVCLQRLYFSLNAWRRTTQELVMSHVQNPRQRGNLPITS